MESSLFLSQLHSGHEPANVQRPPSNAQLSTSPLRVERWTFSSDLLLNINGQQKRLRQAVASPAAVVYAFDLACLMQFAERIPCAVHVHA